MRWGSTPTAAEKIYRLLALAPLAERFVVPTAETGDDTLYTRQGQCGLGEALRRRCA